MKKIIFLVLLLPALVCAQKIKIKKNKVLFDKKEVAIMESPQRDFYTFKYLSGEKAFDVAYKALSVSAIQDHQYLEVTSAEGKKTEILYEILQSSFSSKKIIIRLLSQKYGLIDAKGINKEKVAAFFAEEREIISEKYMQAAAKAKLEADERAKTVGRYKPYVQPDGTITFEASRGTKIVGRISYSASSSAYIITDLDGIRVAIATASNKVGSTAAVAETYSGEIFEFDQGSRTMFTGRFSRTFGQIFVEEMVGRNYLFGHQAKQKKIEIQKEKIKIAKENSVNLYGVEGTVVDKNGKKYTGEVYISFEKLHFLPETVLTDIHDMNSIDNYGKFVSVRYKNAKGRKRVKKFSARQEISFSVIENDRERKYHAMKTKGNAFKKISNASNLGFNNSYFYEEIYEENGHILLIKPGTEDIFVIRVKGQKSGFMIDDRNNEKLSKALAKYLKKCKQVSNDIAAEEFDLRNEENLRQIIQEYNDCGK